MRRAFLVVVATAAGAGVTGCGTAHTRLAAPTRKVAIPADLPPSPATWPRYPHFSQHSCWGRPFIKAVVPITERVAPSYAPRPQRHHVSPAEIVRRFLARFGDRRYIHSITFRAPPPPVGHNIHVLYAGGHPPADQLDAVIHAPLANQYADVRRTPAQNLTYGIAEWEAGLVFGALRDDFCSAGGAPLVWASGDGGGMADKLFALEQRFPNPSPAVFRHRVKLVAERYGFSVVSLRLLDPEQLAPLLVVRTSRNREQFARDVPRILALLDPTSSTRNQSAATFEGFFFAAEDAKGPFLFTDGSRRGTGEGGEWAAAENLYPFPHG